MIRGYVSSDEDDYDDYDFGYSESVIIRKGPPPAFPKIKNYKIREELNQILEESQKIELFMKAVDQGHLNTLEELVSQGVAVDCTDSQEWTPLLKACGLGNSEVVQFLLEHGANPNKDRGLLTPIMTCCTHTLLAEDLKLSCVRLLLQHGADVNAKDKFQTTPLMYAAGSGYADIVTEFLGVPGIDINVQDREGWTALFYAVNNSSLDIVEKLVAAGSDLELKDKYSRTVISLALDKNLMKVAKVLGYVEEPCVFVPKKKLKMKFLDELPDSNGQGGFPSEAQMFLRAFNQFNVKNISFPDLLNATDKDLYEIGVKLKPIRSKILSKGIHKYHLNPWKNFSMHQIKPRVPIVLKDVVAIAGSLAMHLTIANASIRYINTRLSARQNKEVDVDVEKELLICLIGCYKSAENLKVSLSRILEHAEEIKLVIPSDYIHSFKEEKHGKMSTKRYWCIAAAATAGFLIYFRPLRSVTTVFLSLFSQPESYYDFMDYNCELFLDV